MFCRNCGNQMSDDSRFCPRCGTAVTVRPQAAVVPQIPVTSVVETPAPPVVEMPQPPVEQNVPVEEIIQPPVERVEPIAETVQPPVEQTAPMVGMPQPAPEMPAPQAQWDSPKKKGKGKYWLLALLGVVLVVAVIVILLNMKDSGPGGTQITGTPTQSVQEEDTAIHDGSMTVMIYIVGSNLETDNGFASMDLDEMMSASIDTEKHHVLIHTGGAKEWHNEAVSNRKNEIFLLQDGELEKLESNRAEDTCSSDTLAGFLTYGLENYPAERYSLVLWDHGGGPLVGYGGDQKSGNIMALEDIQEALEDAGFGPDQKLELMGFDACLMGSVEVAWVFRDYANYLVASQELEPGCGWNYDWLEAINETIDGEELGKVIVDTYFSGAKRLGVYEDWDMTLSCMDLSQVEEVETRLDALFSKVDADILEGNFKEISRIRRRTKSFGKLPDDEVGCDLVDLMHLTHLLEDEHPREAKKLEQALEDLICYSESNVNNANGVSIYHPYEDREQMSKNWRLFMKLGFASDYGEYLETFIANLISRSSQDAGKLQGLKTEAEESSAEQLLSLQLDQTLAELYGGACYYIVQHMGNNEYMMVSFGMDVTMDDNGLLTAQYGKKAIFVVNESTGQVSELPVAAFQELTNDDRLLYSVPAMLVEYDADGKADGLMVWQMIEVVDGVPVLRGAYAMEDDEEDADDLGLADRTVYNYKDYDSIILASFTVIPPDGTLENCNVSMLEWEEGEDPVYFEVFVEDGIRLEYMSIDGNGEYYAQFEVFDVYDNCYTSEVIPLG